MVKGRDFVASFRPRAESGFALISCVSWDKLFAQFNSLVLSSINGNQYST